MSLQRVVWLLVGVAACGSPASVELPAVAAEAVEPAPQQQLDPRAVVEQYGQALETRAHELADSLWHPGAAVEARLEHRFDGYQPLGIDVGHPEPVEKAGDTLYVRVPIDVVGTAPSGERFEASGTLVLRRAEGETATLSEASWRITQSHVDVES